MNQPTEASASVALVRRAATVWIPVAVFVIATGSLVLSMHETKEVAASSQSGLGPDFDSDGLADAAEFVLKTSPDNPDTDFDGFDDLEEVARGSDPLDAVSTPSAVTLNVGMYAYTENGFLNLHTALYVEGANPNGLEFELGVVIGGERHVIAKRHYNHGTFGFFYPTANEDDMILVLEMPIPAEIVERFGNLSVYSLLTDRSPNGRESVVAVTNVVAIEGELNEVIPAPASVQSGNGIAYRPLSGSGQPAATATPGQIC
jgi:hypothetical protein